MRAIPCEVYSRIVGYFSPVRNWNKGKQREFADRRVYDIAKAQERDAAARDERADLPRGD